MHIFPLTQFVSVHMQVENISRLLIHFKEMVFEFKLTKAPVVTHSLSDFGKVHNLSVLYRTSGLVSSAYIWAYKPLGYVSSLKGRPLPPPHDDISTAWADVKSPGPSPYNCTLFVIAKSRFDSFHKILSSSNRQADGKFRWKKIGTLSHFYSQVAICLNAHITLYNPVLRLFNASIYSMVFSVTHFYFIYTVNPGV